MVMKRSTRRRLTQGVLYAVLVGVAVVAVLLVDWPAVRTNFLDVDVAKDMLPEVVTEAAKNTVVYTTIAFGLGLALAMLLALMKLSPAAPYRWLATVYVELFRSLPALLVITFFALGMPLAFSWWDPPGGFVGAGVIALIFVSAAYMAETLRAGLQAVPKGQTEAARSLGMNGTWTMVSVVIPQAFRIVIPPLTNEFVLLLKDTALVTIVGAQVGQRELTRFASEATSTYTNSTPIVVAAVAYIIITLPLTQLVAWLERRQKRAR